MSHDVLLSGCASTPLAHYLKSLGVLRLVAEQADPEALASWRDGGFRLRSKLDAAALERFFLEDYQPTPLVAPWNGGSGFYPSDNKRGLTSLATSSATRFQPFAEAIALAQRLVAGLESSPKEGAKVRMLAEARRTWSAGALDWLMAATVISGDDWFELPALLGTGGNDGRLDYTNNFMQRLCELFDATTGEASVHAAPMLDAALFGTTTHGLAGTAIGQFHPGSAGGVNGAAGFVGNALVNPWDFVLMLEGAIAFRVAAVRRLDARGLPQASAPFAVRGRAGGYASAAAVDESTRGEQWLPLWNAWASWSEIRGLFAEARMQSGERRAEVATDAARAIAGFGVARGITAFERYGFIERNGQANLAVPLGRWPVAAQPRMELLDDIAEWVEQLRRASQAKGAAASLGRIVRSIEAAIFAVCRDGDVRDRWQALLMVLVEAEVALVRRPRATAEAYLGPIPSLSPGWLDRLGDTPEVRIAAAIASQTAPAPSGLGPIRVHCLPLAAPRFERFEKGESGLVRDPRVVWTTEDPTIGLARVVQRRITDAQKVGAGFGLVPRWSAPVADLEAFVAGRVDTGRLGALARGLMALRWSEVDEVPRGVDADQDRPSLPLLALFRLLNLPYALQPLPASGEPAVVRLLAAGRLDEATTLAIRRLRARGLTPKLRSAAGSSDFSLRLAAALAIPVSLPALTAMRQLVSKPIEAREWRVSDDTSPEAEPSESIKE